jgi:hypothetical protein
MKKLENYRLKLRQLPDWEEYLLKESGLPGPRGNLELAQAVADEGHMEIFERFLNYTPDIAPVNTPEEFLAFCGVVGLGRLAAEGQVELIERLRLAASDPRWRTREAVAMGLQRVGDKDMDFLLKRMDEWAEGSWYEKRAVAAALAEPRLLHDPAVARRVLQTLDRITTSLATAENRKGEDFKALRQCLGYAWSVAVAAFPSEGWKYLERWQKSPDRDIQWIMKENLKKKRLKLPKT